MHRLNKLSAVKSVSMKSKTEQVIETKRIPPRELQLAVEHESSVLTSCSYRLVNIKKIVNCFVNLKSVRVRTQATQLSAPLKNRVV